MQKHQGKAAIVNLTLSKAFLATTLLAGCAQVQPSFPPSTLLATDKAALAKTASDKSQRPAPKTELLVGVDR